MERLDARHRRSRPATMRSIDYRTRKMRSIDYKVHERPSLRLGRSQVLTVAPLLMLAPFFVAGNMPVEQMALRYLSRSLSQPLSKVLKSHTWMFLLDPTPSELDVLVGSYAVLAAGTCWMLLGM